MKKLVSLNNLIFLSIGLLIVVSFLSAAIFGKNGYVDLWAVYQKKKSLEAEITEVDCHNQSLRREIEALDDENREAIERIARTELLFAGDDEIIYLFQNTDKTTNEVEPDAD